MSPAKKAPNNPQSVMIKRVIEEDHADGVEANATKDHDQENELSSPD